MKNTILTLLLLFFYSVSIGQPCPDSVSHNNSTNCPNCSIMIYAYDDSNIIVDSVTCTITSNGLNYNCNSILGTNWPIGTVYLSFSDSAASGSCIYGQNGQAIGNLPIELVSFTGKYESGNVLNWVTASERDNHYFTLEHSVDGKEWTAIKTIPGSGTTNQTSQYKYIHQDFEPVINYYRLSQTDYDGTKKVFTSDIVSIDNRNSRYIVKYVNSIGQTIDKDSPGLIFIVYSDGTIKKHIN
jgi:hypothetical protein